MSDSACDHGYTGDERDNCACPPCEARNAATTHGETDEEFLARLRRLGEDWRYSDEFIGIVVRNRFPRNYDLPSDAERVTS